MGATVWQRDGNGGKTFSTGVQSNSQRPSKRKLVWKRDDQQVCCVCMMLFCKVFAQKRKHTF